MGELPALDLNSENLTDEQRQVGSLCLHHQTASTGNCDNFWGPKGGQLPVLDLNSETFSDEQREEGVLSIHCKE